MPCRSDHLEPTSREAESVRVAKHLLFVSFMLREVLCVSTEYVEKWISDATVGYGAPDRVDELTELLCTTLRNLPKNQLELVVYDAHRPKSRKLANWWERHQKFDESRKKKSKKKTAKKKTAKKKASKKKGWFSK